MSTKVKEILFRPLEKAKQGFMLAAHIPQGRIWTNVFNPESNLGKLMTALGIEHYRFQVLVEKVFTEMDINQATELITSWEKSVNIPDACFTISETIEVRRLQAREKFANFGGAQTAADFVRIAAVFGFNVEVNPGSEGAAYPLPFPIVFGGTPKEAKHTIIVTVLDDISSESTYPLPFPLPFSTAGASFLRCLFETLIPANVKLIINSEV
jgi:hypothetical protein